VFKRNVKIIQNMPIAIMNFPLRETTRFFLQMLLQSTTVILVLVLLKIPITPMAIWVLPGLLFLCVFGLSLTLLFAIIGTYLPDLAASTSSFMRLFFFITPIWWYPGERGGTRALIADLNPLTHFIRLFRYPLLENSPPSNPTLIICALSLLVTASASLMLFAATRRYILLRL
jgi:ABC-type polysaccharide/polyol phosphate export permease